MNNFENTNSRRTRPAKPPLSLDIIIRTAYKLLNENGVSGMSMRKVAKALDTGPASLYVYVENYQKLSAYVLDYGLHKVELGETNTTQWKEAISNVLQSYSSVLAATPGLAEISLTTSPIGKNSININEYLLNYLHQGGISARGAAWGIDLLLLYVSSLSYERVLRSNQTDNIDDLAAQYNKIDISKYPMISMLKSELFTGDGERFSWGIEVILQGLMSIQNE